MGSLAEAVKAVAAFTRVSGVPDYREEWDGQSIYEVILISQAKQRLPVRMHKCTNARGCSGVHPKHCMYEDVGSCSVGLAGVIGEPLPPLVEAMQSRLEQYYLRNFGDDDKLCFVSI